MPNHDHGLAPLAKHVHLCERAHCSTRLPETKRTKTTSSVKRLLRDVVALFDYPKLCSHKFDQWSQPSLCPLESSGASGSQGFDRLGDLSRLQGRAMAMLGA